jgi:hypothetical protein
MTMGGEGWWGVGGHCMFIQTVVGIECLANPASHDANDSVLVWAAIKHQSINIVAVTVVRASLITPRHIVFLSVCELLWFGTQQYVYDGSCGKLGPGRINPSSLTSSLITIHDVRGPILPLLTEVYHCP